MSVLSTMQEIEAAVLAAAKQRDILHCRKRKVDLLTQNAHHRCRQSQPLGTPWTGILYRFTLCIYISTNAEPQRQGNLTSYVLNMDLNLMKMYAHRFTLERRGVSDLSV